MMAITAAATQKMTMRTCIQIQKRGSCTAAEFDEERSRGAGPASTRGASPPYTRLCRVTPRLLDDGLTQGDGHRVHTRVGLELHDRALGVRLDGLGAQPDPPCDLLGVEALGQELEDLPLALGERRVRGPLGHQEGGRQRRV